MSFDPPCRRRVRVCHVGGLVGALLLMGGCGPKATPPAPAKPKAAAVASSSAAPADTNEVDQYASVFDDLPSSKGKDPFFPTSHRRDPKIEAPPVGETPSTPTAPVLVLKAIVGTGKHSQAVINNEIMGVGESQPIRLPDGGHVQVKCLSIGSNYVTIKVDGEAPKQLIMIEEKKN